MPWRCLARLDMTYFFGSTSAAIQIEASLKLRAGSLHFVRKDKNIFFMHRPWSLFFLITFQRLLYQILLLLMMQLSIAGCGCRSKASAGIPERLFFFQTIPDIML